MNLKREPALLAMSLVAPLVQFILMLWPDLDPGTQSVLTGVIPAVAGVIVAVLVRSDKLVPAILGLAQSALLAAIAFGLTLTADQQSAVMAFVALVVGVVIRDRVVAPVSPSPVA